MNCIVQALTHTPLLRDYFLSDRHVCQFTEQPDHCLVCEVSRLFQEVIRLPMEILFLFSTNFPSTVLLRQPRGVDSEPTAALDLDPRQTSGRVWTTGRSRIFHCHLGRAAPALQGGQLDWWRFQFSPVQLHYRSNIHGGTSIGRGVHILQVIFRLVQSPHRYNKFLFYSGVSTTIDPFWDISLDLGTTQASGDTSKVPKSLVDCLERFTRPEHLGSSAKIKCNTCQSYQESTKQLTMKKLPVVASFHLKVLNDQFQWSIFLTLILHRDSSIPRDSTKRYLPS